MKKLSGLVLLFLLVNSAGAQDSAINISELNFLVGTWKVDVKARLSAQGPWETSTGSASISGSLNGTILEETFAGTRKGKPFFAKTVFGVNNATNSFSECLPIPNMACWCNTKAGDRATPFTWTRTGCIPMETR